MALWRATSRAHGQRRRRGEQHHVLRRQQPCALLNVLDPRERFCGCIKLHRARVGDPPHRVPALADLYPGCELLRALLVHARSPLALARD